MLVGALEEGLAHTPPGAVDEDASHVPTLAAPRGKGTRSLEPGGRSRFNTAAMTAAVSVSEAVLTVAFLVAATATLHRDLPLQNRVAAVLLVGACRTGAAVLPSLLLGRPLPGWTTQGISAAGTTAFLLAARGTSKWILRNRRTSPRFGYGLLALATLLGTLGGKLIPAGTSSVPGFLTETVSILANLVALVAGLPWFLSKRPVPEISDPRPAGVWTAGVLAFGFLQARHGNGMAAVLAASLAAAAWIPWPASRETPGPRRPS